ncbi:MAG: protein kinase [Pseudomonadota bacterium]|nr:protein kinase [Pseudomonadota bacterium]
MLYTPPTEGGTVPTGGSTNGGAPPGVLFVGRYTLLEILGSGGTGVVHKALDTITGELVAIKILSPLATAAHLRQRREVLALRVLQAPGVVRLIDDGVSDGRPFIVMELIDGSPFPGEGQRLWADVAPLAISLLESLARVHANGVIHRDLKPANVLVNRAGRPIILDFGLARSDTFDLAITRADTVVGTPRYQAPEQLVNGPLDARTDLYAVGLMLYEVLAGRPAHTLENVHVLFAARVLKDAPPLQWAATHVPPEVCRVVDNLLARLPEARPRSATEVVRALRGLSADDGRPPFPWLGPEAPIRAAVDAARSQRSFDIQGPAGSGRSRCLQEIVAALARGGRRAARTTRGARPYESLRAVIGDPDTAETAVDAGSEPRDRSGADPADIARLLERRLRETLAGGTVVIVDDAEDVDPWSAELLDRARGDGAIIRAWRAPRAEACALAPLSEVALRPLFHGPDRLLHLREDASHALAVRTAGHPARVAAEVSAWVSGGYATWRDGRLALDRTALDRLEGGVSVQVPPPPIDLDGAVLKRGLEQMLAWVTLAWPHSSLARLRAAHGGGWEVDMMLTELERAGAVRRTEDGRFEPRHAALALHDWSSDQRRDAHALLAASLPPGTHGRFAHLIGAGDFSGAAREARLLASRLIADGYVGRAIGVLSQGLYAAREAGDSEAEAALLGDATQAALVEGVAGAIKYVRYELARTSGASVGPLDTLLRAGLAHVGGDVPGLEKALAELPPFEDPALEVWRRAVVLYREFRVGLPAASAYVDACLVWAEASGSSFLLGRVLGWKGLLRYQEGQYLDAAAWHLRALPLKEGAADRLSTMVNAASAFLEAQRLDEASRWATEALALAAERRSVLFEARATWMLRMVAYRTDRALAPDLELVDAIGRVGAPLIEANVCFTEAGIAWRSEAHAEEAGWLARKAEALYLKQRNEGTRILGTALALTCEGERDPEPWRALAEAALAAPPGTGLAQTLAMVAKSGVVWTEAWSDAVTRAIAAAPSPVPSQRRLLLAETEIIAYCSAAADREVVA